jgi:hypothetical protein
MERLQSLGEFTPPTLRQLELALDHALEQPRTVVTADLWDVERLEACTVCREHRVERLRRMNLSGVREPSVVCAACEGS